MAGEKGMDLPVVYNSSGYEKIEILELLEGYVDVYLPDMKYMESELAQKFSHAADYPETAKAAIGEMVRQTGKCEFGEDGYYPKGNHSPPSDSAGTYKKFRKSTEIPSRNLW